MPTYEYMGPTPQMRPKFTADANGNQVELAEGTPISDPIDYQMPGREGRRPLTFTQHMQEYLDSPDVPPGRQFEAGEHVFAAENPDPTRFTEVPN